MALRAGQRPMDEWCTPYEVGNPLCDFYAHRRGKRRGQVGIDPCSNSQSIINATKVYIAGALHLPWWIPEEDIEDGYINPPFSRLDRWSEKLRSEVQRSRGKFEATYLVPVAVSTKWWRIALEMRKGPGGRSPRVMVTRRLPFLDDDGTSHSGARFDTALMFYGTDKRWRQFQRVFADISKATFDGADWRFE